MYNFVIETKGSVDPSDWREAERSKIQCARTHFKAISNDEVIYDVVDSIDVFNSIVVTKGY